MHLRIAVDYSARETLLRAATRLNPLVPVSHHEFAQILADVSYAGSVAPDIDLLIRTGGEQRLSDCLLWEGAYAEMVFSPRMWPDFDATDLEAAVQEFRSRQRRFGRVPEIDSTAAMIQGHEEHSEDAALKTA